MSSERREGSSHARAEVMKREALQPLVVRLLKRSQSALSPDVYLVNLGENLAVWKDYSAKAVIGRLWGRQVIAREAKALEQLRGIDGIPQLIARVDSTGILMEYCDGEILMRRQVRQQVSPAFFEAVLELLEKIHARGVAHGDVRRKNILVRPDKSPALIDFQTSWFSGRNPLRYWFFQLMCTVDKWNLLRIKARSFPRYMTEAERAFLENPPLLLRLGRTFRRRMLRRKSPSK